MPKSSTSISGPHELRAVPTLSQFAYLNHLFTRPAVLRDAAMLILFPSQQTMHLRSSIVTNAIDAQVERRCASLTALLHRLNPDVDIEDALKTTSVPPRGLQAAAYDGVNPASVDEFEWSESSLGSPGELRRVGLDGMASLPTGGTEAGYLGSSAGSSILRTVPGLIPEQSGLETNRRKQVSSEDPNQNPDLLLQAHLGTSAILDGLVNAYFTYYNTSYPILHESTFRQQYQNRHRLQDRSSWHPIFYIVLAIGNWILGGTSGSRECQYYSAARSHKGNYLQKRDRPNTGYNFIGIAYRMALGLGLHRMCANLDTSDTIRPTDNIFRHNRTRAAGFHRKQHLYQRLCRILSDGEEARNMCHYVAIETIQDITTFCLDYRDNIHVGLSWYATYFLFQATIVLSIHYLRAHQPLDMGPDSVNQELWALSISRARDCLAQLSQNNEAASRCLAVLERIRDQSERSQQSSLTPSGTRPNASVHADHTQLQPALATEDTVPTTLAIDPALQILFQDTAWNNDIFEGLQGFPITDEVEAFDYMPSNA
ncbi:hypothetical protein BDV24DRAFT_176741 [Aspergillus arachidicola]|uniref:Transcription factor domain-containing protein n=1 Tax=Aspergillus arachidicola TaxID=656916 RepID=A0A5N6Y287_9EURO|nr:hypothetical protein BDV24DRAFT_176741 [Aspergillus arachidicola]